MITSPQNPTVKTVRSLQSLRKTREAEGRFVIEGVRLAEEAVQAQSEVHLALYTPDLDARSRAALRGLEARGAKVEAVSEAVMAAAAETQTPAGLLAVVAMPTFLVLPNPAFALIVDRLGDPGNLGTVLRTADAAGVQVVFLMPGTVDAYNPKVVRAGMGAHFHLPIIDAHWETLAGQLGGAAVWLAEARAGEPYDQVDWRGACAIVLGSEAAGPSAAARAFTPQRVHIPMPGRAESLNAAVAAGVLLFEAARQKRAS
mgnify:CR=1 FL=1